MTETTAELALKVDGCLHQDARLRVTRIIARLRDLFFADPPVLTRSHLSGLVGTSREMTGRVLRDLEREGDGRPDRASPGCGCSIPPGSKAEQPTNRSGECPERRRGGRHGSRAA